nr:hypothetical protein [Tanacetum cinerariifolium]
MERSMKRPSSDNDESYNIGKHDETIDEETQVLLENKQLDSFLVNNLEKTITQMDQENYDSIIDGFVDDAEVMQSIRHIDIINTAYSEGQKVKGKRIDGKFKPIYYASKTLNTQEHYTTTEKELLVVVKFYPYLILSKTMVYTNHSALKLKNPQMEILNEGEIVDEFLGEHLMMLKSKFNDDEPWAITHILERLVWYNPKDWSEKLNDALCAFRTAYKTPTGCTPFRMVLGKACHLPLNELAELRDEAYENTIIYKERTKKWRESRLHRDKDFKVGDKVVLYNSYLKMYPQKLKSKWYESNIVKTVCPYRAVEIIDKNEFSFKVSGHRLKKYYKENTDKEDEEVVELKMDAT